MIETLRPLDQFAIHHPEELPFLDRLNLVANLTQTVFEARLFAPDDPIKQAMQYAVSGGKAMRAFFVWETGRLHGVQAESCKNIGAAIEALHSYSLVHDDLPCMDDDDLRRGRPTVHRKWNEATAVLAGDALQSFAFELIGKTTGVSESAKVELMSGLAVCAGADGMVGGQALDIAAETAAEPFTINEITRMQAGKTGALLTWSCVAGAVMAQADQAPLRAYGDAIGLAFQIADDVLDVEGDAAAVGKAVGKDEAAGKATFVSLLGLDGAKRRADSLVEEACDALSIYGGKSETLRDAAKFVVQRRH